MKNIILRQSLAYDGATIEGLLAHLGRQFLATYDDMRSRRASLRANLRFAAAHNSGWLRGKRPPASAASMATMPWRR